jgi:hypothetical protein
MKLCKNYLRPSHEAKDCKSASCKLCHQKHNTLLHPYVPTRVTTEPQPSVINCNQSKTQSEVLLSTVIVNVRDRFGNLQPCRALLDAGSQSNFILQSTCKRLGLAMQSINLSVTGFEKSISTIKNSVDVEIHSLATSYKEKLHCLVSKTITQNIPSNSFSKKDGGQVISPPVITLIFCASPLSKIPSVISPPIFFNTFLLRVIPNTGEFK